jgi:hypothetical protein
VTDEPTRDRPDAVELLRVARASLEAEILPGLAGEARLTGLMVARAMAIAERELRAPVAEFPDAAALAAAIRAGRHDGDLDLHARLLADAAARTAIANPKALGRAG